MPFLLKFYLSGRRINRGGNQLPSVSAIYCRSFYQWRALCKFLMNELHLVKRRSQNREDVASSIERLNSGKRVNSAADNPADLAQTSRLGAQIASLKAATKNANNAMSLLETADALEEIADTLHRIRELAVQASSSSRYRDRALHPDRRKKSAQCRDRSVCQQHEVQRRKHTQRKLPG